MFDSSLENRSRVRKAEVAQAEAATARRQELLFSGEHGRVERLLYSVHRLRQSLQGCCVGYPDALRRPKRVARHQRHVCNLNQIPAACTQQFRVKPETPACIYSSAVCHQRPQIKSIACGHRMQRCSLMAPTEAGRYNVM